MIYLPIIAQPLNFWRDFPADLQQNVSSCSTSNEFAEIIEARVGETSVAAVISIVRACKDQQFSWYAFNDILKQYEPKYLYFDEYYQMLGCENIDALQQRSQQNALKPSDHPLLGLIELARLDLNQLLQHERTQDLKNKLEGAGNLLTHRVLPYWSQNKHLQMRFDVRPARQGDPLGMQAGTNIWGDVYDTKHLASTSMGSRSRGFVWFFSFVAWYSQIKRKGENVILLLDEPGLSLHGRAQGDLLRYFETELKPNHQVIYTTHSPFMVDPDHFERVRIVQDKGIDADVPLPKEEDGTKILTNVFDASDDSIFPLQGALGYEIHQTLFVGPNCLIVEGPEDLLFLKGMSSIIERDGGSGLSPKWTITPVGGSGKVPTFVALLAPQKGLRIATLLDIQAGDQQSRESLYKRRLLQKKRVLTYAEFTQTAEADVADMFERDFYLSLVNAEYTAVLQRPLATTDLNSHIPRVVRAIEVALKQAPLKKGEFGHFRPARYFSENINKLAPHISLATRARFESAFASLNALLP